MDDSFFGFCKEILRDFWPWIIMAIIAIAALGATASGAP